MVYLQKIKESISFTKSEFGSSLKYLIRRAIGANEAYASLLC
jgi:hypothetical protein